MLCSQCKQKEASVFFQAILNNQVIQMNLCDSCAKEKGVSWESGTLSISDWIAHLAGGTLELPREGRVFKCKNCGLKYSEFKETGRLGCDSCYESFRPLLKDLIRRIHGFDQHKGKSSFSREKSPEPGAPELADLKARLSAAIRKENFEEAVRLRDRIRQLEREK